ncbi:3-deoxy-manno-octulosonate cytidylyltransferase [Vibrio parahaemolyticus]
MKTRIVIPARYNSSRLEGKPMLEILNRPIFWHVYQRCLEAKFEREDIVLATDDERIFEKAISLGLNAMITSNEHESGTDRIFEVATSGCWEPDDIVINVQGDEPLICVKLIRSLADFCKARGDFDIVTAVSPIRTISDLENPNVVKAIMGLNNLALYFTRSPSPYNREDPNNFDLAFKHIGIYAYSVKVLSKFCSFEESPLENYEKLEQLRALSNGLKIGAYLYNGEVHNGVDTLSDYIEIKEKMERKSG